MGERVTFRSNGGEAGGYLAVPQGGAQGAIPLLVIQEWWGLVPHIEQVCDRLAGDGFVALAPDLYHGTAVPVGEPDEAGKLMMALNVDEAVKDLSGAIDELLARTGAAALGVTGFCMGGGLTWVAACQRPDVVRAIVPWYGVIPWEGVQPDYSKLEAVALGHYAERDGFFGPELVNGLQAQLDELGKQSELKVHPGVDHAFFNDTRPEVYDRDTAEACYAETVAFFRQHLG